MKAYYHLPGLFEFYELYKEFLPLYRKHREYFYDWCDIGSIIIYSDILLDYIKENYPDFYFISSTTKVLTDFSEFENELNREDFRYVVPDFRLNKSFDKLKALSQHQKEKVEFLCNECCWFGCTDRKKVL